MVFNSLTFLVFLGVTLSIYYKLQLRAQNRFLLLVSYIFYAWWDWRFLFLLIFTSVFDYYCALAIERQQIKRNRRLWLGFSIVLNMGVLCAFKYFNFFADSFAALLHLFGMQVTLPVLHVILPLGISFYTFLSMSYTIDVYRGEMKATRDPVAFLLFVAFFPHLVASPIVRASFLLPQCQAPRVIKHEQVANGFWLILLGYLKKTVIADRMAGLVDYGFNQQGALFTDANAWLILYAFALQIYGDFSGYSDIARGLSKVMGFELPVNFRAPYLVTNPSSFWHHWHITLSTWLRDYLYIPLGGNRKGPARTYLNLMTTMVLGGLWHGAGVAYLLWGAYHGLLLAIHRAWTGWRTPSTPGARPIIAMHRVTRIALALLFFHVTCVGWLLFRAGALPAGEQFPAIRSFLGAMFTFNLDHGVSPLFRPVLLLGALTLFLQWKVEAMDCFHGWRLSWQAIAVVGTLSAIASLGVFKGAQFIYFQF